MTEDGEQVQLFVYDLSRGLARQFSPMLIGKQIDGIWHSSIVVGGEEYYFGFGINVSLPGQSPFGQPTQVIDLGVTFIPQDVRDEFLADLSERYTPQAYNLLHNNCNNFSNELANLLVGQSIPAHITGLPAEVLSTPFGQMMLPMLQGLEQQLGSVRQQPYTPHSHPQHPAAAAAAAAPAASPATQQQEQQDQAEQQPEQGPAETGGAGPSSTSSAEGAVGAAVNSADALVVPDSPANGGPAIEAAAEQIAAATGLAMVEEAESRDQQQHQEQEQRDGAGVPAMEPTAAEAPAEPARAEEEAAQQQQAAAGTPPSDQVEASAPAAASVRPPRSAAAAAAAAAAERRALAAAGQGSAGSAQGPTQPGAVAGGMGSVEGSGVAEGAEEGRLKVECEEEVRTEFARLMAAGEMTAVEAAAAAQRVAARGQFAGTAKAQA